jgi:hypothetical protein
MTSYKFYFHVICREMNCNCKKIKELHSLYVRIVTVVKFWVYCNNNISFMAVVGLGLLIVEVSRSYLDTPHSVGLLWTSYRPVSETATCQHTILTSDNHDPQSKRAVADPRLRPRGHWNRTFKRARHTAGGCTLQSVYCAN